jgi:hypothetical protein
MIQIDHEAFFDDNTDKRTAPERIRTFDLCLRRAALYPAELRAHISAASTVPAGVQCWECA